MSFIKICIISKIPCVGIFHLYLSVFFISQEHWNKNQPTQKHSLSHGRDIDVLRLDEDELEPGEIVLPSSPFDGKRLKGVFCCFSCWTKVSSSQNRIYKYNCDKSLCPETCMHRQLNKFFFVTYENGRNYCSYTSNSHAVQLAKHFKCSPYCSVSCTSQCHQRLQNNEIDKAALDDIRGCGIPLIENFQTKFGETFRVNSLECCNCLKNVGNRRNLKVPLLHLPSDKRQNNLHNKVPANKCKSAKVPIKSLDVASYSYKKITKAQKFLPPDEKLLALPMLRLPHQVVQPNSFQDTYFLQDAVSRSVLKLPMNSNRYISRESTATLETCTICSDSSVNLEWREKFHSCGPRYVECSLNGITNTKGFSQKSSSTVKVCKLILI